MTDILIRNVDEALDRALRERAKAHGRSREAEIKRILEAALSQQPRPRSLAEALLAIPTLDTDPDTLFERADSPARESD